MDRVFCIGWHKTGTTTLGVALIELGYNVMGARMDLAQKLLEGKLEEVLSEADQVTALQDIPWAALFIELDQRYPGSKFILTVRDEEKWIKSAMNHFGEKYYELHEWLYGVGVLRGNEKIYVDRFRSHYQEVKKYFENRADDLLVMDVTKGDGWEKLCDFLEKPIPRKSFPYSNKGKHNYTWKDHLMNSLRSLIPMWIRRWRVKTLEKLGLHTKRRRFNNFEQHQEYRKSLQKPRKRHF